MFHLVKGVQCYELFGGIALKNDALFIIIMFLTTNLSLFINAFYMPGNGVCKHHSILFEINRKNEMKNEKIAMLRNQ